MKLSCSVGDINFIAQLRIRCQQGHSTASYLAFLTSDAPPSSSYVYPSCVCHTVPCIL